MSRAVQVQMGESTFYLLLELEAPQAVRPVQSVHLVQTFRVPLPVWEGMQIPGHGSKPTCSKKQTWLGLACMVKLLQKLPKATRRQLALTLYAQARPTSKPRGNTS